MQHGLFPVNASATPCFATSPGSGVSQLNARKRLSTNRMGHSCSTSGLEKGKETISKRTSKAATYGCCGSSAWWEWLRQYQSPSFCLTSTHGYDYRCMWFIVTGACCWYMRWRFESFIGSSPSVISDIRRLWCCCRAGALRGV